MKIRLNVTRGDRLAEVEYEVPEGVLIAREDMVRVVGDVFAALEAAIVAGPPPPGPGTTAPPKPCSPPPRPSREPGDDEPGPGPAPRPGPISGKDAIPRNGRQLWAWASNHGSLDRLKTLAKTQPGRIVDWPEDLVQWAHRELTAKAGAGKWGSN